ncbi:hypothetical protein A1QO_00745 [Vibrio genomosp. F10 str. ZF-129]|uniref:Uncharacterized protein n=1 Tax=Vibrio genomosp. F10 str. ZF-129 TaxID=1187848 RepID=A0A1E5BGL9_9VIBR|nr:hypothetical protein [Vibrio genomosp. F10]OEE35320.1 hypothetical protein A1QO_00745 [Vibrio genomosp. F10 str. ZF-129]
MKKITSVDQLIECTKSISAELILPEGTSDEKLTNLIQENQSKKAQFLSELFSCPASGDGYIVTLYASSNEHATKNKQSLLDMGYKNIRTYIPLVCDGNNGSKPDPRLDRKFATEAHCSVEVTCLKGDKLLEALKFLTEDFIEYATAIYACGLEGIATFSFDNIEKANLLAALVSLTKERTKDAPSFKAHGIKFEAPKVKQTSLDVWQTTIKVNFPLNKTQ